MTFCDALVQVGALRAEKMRWELLTAERDEHRGRTGELEAEVARLKVRLKHTRSSQGSLSEIGLHASFHVCAGPQLSREDR